MKVNNFFKILNKKIEKYDRLAENPFTSPKSFIFIWIENEKENLNDNNKYY